MSVQSEVSRIKYVGNNSTTVPYPVPFYFINNSHLKVVVTDVDGTETELLIGSGFRATGAGGVSGNVTTTAAIDSTKNLTIYREVPALQLTEFENNDQLPSDAIEKALDSVVMIAQQMMRKVERCLRVSDASTVLSPFPASGLTSNAVPVVGPDGTFHLWTFQRLAEELSWTSQIPATLNFLQILYPVGCIHITQRTENPRDTFGFGTWVRFGAGKMLLALDPSNADYSSIGNTGGEYTHTLTNNELPGHVHVIASVGGTAESGGSHNHVTGAITGSTNITGDHNHSQKGTPVQVGSGGGYINALGDSTGVGNTSTTGNHSHTVTIPSVNLSGGTHTHAVTIPEHSTAATGDGGAHNNMPPFIVVNMWTRVLSDVPESGFASLPFPADPTLFVDKETGHTIELQFENEIPKYVNKTHPE